MTHVPATNASALSAKCAALLRANGELIGEILQTIPADKQEALNALLAGGGWLGLECAINRSGTNRICLVGQEHEGGRLVFATVENK